MGKYGEALGIWNLTVGGADLHLKPKKGDNLRLLKILMSEDNKKDKSLLLERFAKWLTDLIKRDEPPADENELLELEEYVEFNLNELFEETMVKFRWTTREQLEKFKQEAPDFLKKMQESV